MYFKSFTSNLKNLTQGLAFPNKQLDLLLAILAVPITKYQVNLIFMQCPLRPPVNNRFKIASMIID